VRVELRRLQKRLGTTAIYVTHDQEEAMSLSDRIAVMRAGHLEQVGTPEEVYARPNSLFVAEFVGQVNALPGRVLDRSDGRASVETLNHRIQVPVDRCPANDVLVLVRPEAVRLGGTGTGGIAGVVEDLEYLGDQIEYRIRVGAAIILAVESAMARSTRVGQGDRVGLEFIEDALHLLPAEGSGPGAARELLPGASAPAQSATL
jgi:ABC-type Fe3+/spermidine/putrescine transport system ATPase subunit